MKLSKLNCFLIYTALLFSFCFSQSGHFISGKVVDRDNTPLFGANIILKGTFMGSTSDFEGNYRIENIDSSHPQFKKLDPLSQNLYEIFHKTTLPTLLRNYDRYSMANGVEVRMPFMDHRLVTYTFSLPWTSKVGGTYTKRIMRDALRGILPEQIRTRRDKIGWNAPMHEWFNGPLKNEIETMISTNSMPKKVKEVWKDFQKITNPNFMDGQKVWKFLMPYLWKKALFKDSI